MGERRPKRPVGRPPGQKYEVSFTVRLSTEEAGKLRILAKRWACSLSGAVRRLLGETNGEGVASDEAGTDRRT